MAKPQHFGQRLARILRHHWLDERDAHKAVPPELVERLARRVTASEQRHSGQIRLYVEAGLPLSYLWRGATP
ncbi:MAG TPA: TPM domain-containing protein, partial [Ramlibacter sp.]|nr:TPM domain-containing protein [Ramlibacter sp.]